ncbi:hypothetical protein [Nocardioides nitrophenolicus]|uniref:hypothetical protein n=1 Tax=Nocardioides nitrophenolicus TaxID=60489 RepID=UPI001956CA4B|nr:hypothetical protein [Nocardioides nitrophenolicus]MBM7517857.1 hypothetical protein [Nocardioides nitrophenolicus]
MSRAWHAWVDESMSIGVDRSGFYVLAASVGDPSAAEAMRSAMRELMPKPRRRLHWHSEAADTRRAAVDRIAALDLVHVVVVRELVGGVRRVAPLPSYGGSRLASPMGIQRRDPGLKKRRGRLPSCGGGSGLHFPAPLRGGR